MSVKYIKYFSSLLLFGFNGVVASFISMSSYEIVLLRCLIGVCFLAAVFALSRQNLTCLSNKRELAFIAASGTAMGLSWMLLFKAYELIGVSIAPLAHYCGPVIVMLLSPLIFKEKLTAIKISGFCAVLLGMFLVNGSSIAKESVSHGLSLAVLSAFMYAAMVIFNKKAKSIQGLENSMLQTVASFITVGIFSICRGGLSMSIAASDIPPILCLGIVNTGLGCYLYFSSIPRLRASSVAVCGYIEPLSALVFSALFLGEKLSAVQIVGAALILGGAAFSEIKFKSIRKKFSSA